eukprot:gnl/MRDRNA2_/MRDRNA2_100328_c0_seq1.p2 gnl/MRDRNA2_/MRDRNA2_100328_c0~~gnl/MRDRNA2_/MRDRNA2_100328_c0_seq1.p2  ORF type:complete len:179 (+),score=57.43 gnl/MRDRNA2_/MRDRNA2_100328_c0_seq1:91-627(+)
MVEAAAPPQPLDVLDPSELMTPSEDVRAYLEQTLLPVLSPAIEKLLHHAHENGELQEALKQLEQRTATKKPVKGKAEGEEAQSDMNTAESSSATSAEAAGFNPLVWLSDHLRQFAKEPSGKYREQFEQRVAELQRRDQQDEEEEGAETKAAGTAATPTAPTPAEGTLEKVAEEETKGE